MSFMVWNNTDGIYAHPEPFATKGEAERFITDFPKRFELQSYYLTANLERITPSMVELIVERVSKRVQESD